MGYIVSSLTRLQTNINGYHIYLVRDHELKGIARDLPENFGEYGKRIGTEAAIIRASLFRGYISSLRVLLDRDIWFRETIGDERDLPPGIIITRPSLNEFAARSGQAFIYVSGDVINEAYVDKIELSQDIVELCRHDNAEFILKIIKYSRNSIAEPKSSESKLFHKLLEAAIVQPNWNGMGVDIKKLFDKRKKDNTPYDCVVRVC